jgi:hypothetical protein
MIYETIESNLSRVITLTTRTEMFAVKRCFKIAAFMKFTNKLCSALGERSVRTAAFVASAKSIGHTLMVVISHKFQRLNSCQGAGGLGLR